MRWRRRRGRGRRGPDRTTPTAAPQSSACSASIRAGRLVSACFSLKLNRRFGAGAGGADRGACRLRGLHGRLDGLRLDPPPALRQHVGVAAGIFLPAAVAFGDDHRGRDAVEEVAVVADQQHRAGIVGQQLLQQVERFEVEIVGRLVEHQQVGGRGQRARQQQPAALAAGERADRRARLLRDEQEILHVADHVARRLRRRSPVAARRRSASSSSVGARIEDSRAADRG